MILYSQNALPRFWIWIKQGSKYVSVTQGCEYAWIFLICLAEYARICTNMPKSVWTAFVLYFPVVIPHFLEVVVTYFNVYTKLEVLVWRKMRLFSWRQNLIFSIVDVSVLFGFCFRLNTFTSKISNLLSVLGADGVGSCESWYMLF